jgi:hypothetical protein
LYYKGSKEFLEADKSRLTGDTQRQATSSEVEVVRRENEQEVSFFSSLLVFEIFDDIHPTQSNLCSGKLKGDRVGNGS